MESPNAALFSFDPGKTPARERRQLQKDAPVTSIGRVAPDFVLHDLDGKEARLSDLRAKTILLDFWATWCAPSVQLCRRQSCCIANSKRKG
jgi:hypothetical protein